MTLIHIPLQKICQNIKDEDSKLGFTLIYQLKKSFTAYTTSLFLSHLETDHDTQIYPDDIMEK